jgi:hypothetical protein
MKSLVVCVKFDDFLTLTLPRNARHFSDTVVVTTPEDVRTQGVVDAVPTARCHLTRIFYDQGASFNKGAALEQALDALAPTDWLVVWDADIVMPATMEFVGVEPSCLYNARRRMCCDPRSWDGSADWSAYPIRNEGKQFPGYFQLYHVADPNLGSRPWYDARWLHGGGYDSDFMNRWPEEHRRRLPFEVLHLGEPFRNWWGRETPRIDDGTVPPGAGERRRRMRQMWKERDDHGYAKERLSE